MPSFMMSVSCWQQGALISCKLLSDLRSLAAHVSCNCICFWLRQGKNSRKKSHFAVSGNGKPNRPRSYPDSSCTGLGVVLLILWDNLY